MEQNILASFVTFLYLQVGFLENVLDYQFECQARTGMLEIFIIIFIKIN